MKYNKGCLLLITLSSVFCVVSSEKFLSCTYTPLNLLYIQFDCAALSENINQTELFNDFEKRSIEYLGSDCSSYESQLKYFAFQFNFKNCEFQRIPDKFFQRLENTEEIYLNNSGIETIDSKSFSSTSLKLLWVSHNNLTSLPALLFSNTPQIKNADFSHNHIQTIDRYVFGGAANKLEVINFSHNLIKTLNKDLFANLNDLVELNLNHNQIESFDPELSDLEKLKRLRLDNNKLKRIDCNVFLDILPVKASVDISNNEIEQIDLKCNKNCESNDSGCISLVMEGNRMTNLLLPDSNLTKSLESLSVAANKVNTISIKSDLIKLKHLDVAGNGLANAEDIFKHCSGLEGLDLSLNSLHELRVNSFAKMTQLKNLNLSNGHLSQIDYGTFSYTRSLVVLDLSHNHLQQLNFDLFLPSLDRLIQLNLISNNLKELTGWENSIFPNLNVLGIANNQFNCSYLGKLLRSIDFTRIHLMANPTNREYSDETKNIHGIKCRDEQNDTLIVVSPRSLQPKGVDLKLLLTDLTVGQRNDHNKGGMAYSNDSTNYAIILLVIVCAAYIGVLTYQKLVKNDEASNEVINEKEKQTKPEIKNEISNEKSSVSFA